MQAAFGLLSRGDGVRAVGVGLLGLSIWLLGWADLARFLSFRQHEARIAPFFPPKATGMDELLEFVTQRVKAICLQRVTR